MISNRVADEQFSDDVEFEGRYAVDKVHGKKRPWRVYEAHDSYTQTTGGSTKRGPVVRRYDLDARDDEGKIGEWATKEEAIAYIKRWLELPPRRKKS